ncbi:uncharacterized protein LOC122943252 [Bufo gargarizans]|uniref:uncharacterized protein LOC122943252 n=1 Tax=Bufo gargarizans TaxID=30331 RepID=UPI001CF1D982|nr:uncharacterized protein LOC122943252 [Bufo gargarizans]
MGSMSSMISQTISQALAAHAPGPSTQLPVLTNPQPTIEPPAQETLTGVIQATHDSALRSRKRALPRQAERTRKWKCARAQTDDIDSDVESDMEAYAEASGQSEGEMESEFPDDAGPRPSTSGSVGASATAPNTVSTLVDPSGIPLFDPDSLHHPRSAEWLPVAHVSDYLEHWVRRPLSKEARSKLRAECPRPLIPNKVCDTPSVDPKMTQFLAKTGWNPCKGLDSAIRSCQDKLLDIFGPLAKIFEMAESARADGSPIDPEELTGWIQRAICIAGSTNSSLAIERRKAILFKIDPKLANLALTESGRDAQGLLFGDSFIKDLSRYVGAFTALDKAQSSMRRVFQGRVSTRAGSSRGRLSGRSSFQAAPWCFTKLLRPVVAWLRSRGVRLVIYLDDILIMHQCQAALLRHLQWTSDLLSALGFLLNPEKSCLTPSRRMEFLGFTVDSVAESLSLPSEKLRTIRKELRHALSASSLSLRHLARIIGLLASSIQAVFPAPLHYRALQRLKIAHLRSGASFADMVVLDQEAREELRWWLDNLEAWNGRAIFGFQPEFTIESDASLLGWGAHCEGVSTGGRWSEAESHLHINALELLTGSFAIRSFSNGMAHACIRLRMDNVSAVRYVNHLGGTQSATLARLAKEFWSYCLSRDIMVQAEYLPGLHNVRADRSSRCFTDGSDWRLAPEMFSTISDTWGPCAVDLFASRLNTHLPRFFSWRPDSEAEAVDAFLQDWSSALQYSFPPFAMIPRMLLQVRRQVAELVVVIPFWGTQAWYPVLLELLTDVPLLLPGRTDLLQGPLGAPHPLLLDGSLQLLACPISGLPERSQAFRRQLDASWTTLGLPAPENLTGQLGLAGAWNGTLIPFRRL